MHLHAGSGIHNRDPLHTLQGADGFGVGLVLRGARRPRLRGVLRTPGESLCIMCGNCRVLHTQRSKPDLFIWMPAPSHPCINYDTAALRSDLKCKGNAAQACTSRKCKVCCLTNLLAALECKYAYHRNSARKVAAEPVERASTVSSEPVAPTVSSEPVAPSVSSEPITPTSTSDSSASSASTTAISSSTTARIVDEAATSPATSSSDSTSSTSHKAASKPQTSSHPNNRPFAQPLNSLWTPGQAIAALFTRKEDEVRRTEATRIQMTVLEAQRSVLTTVQFLVYIQVCRIVSSMFSPSCLCLCLAKRASSRPFHKPRRRISQLQSRPVGFTRHATSIQHLALSNL